MGDFGNMGNMGSYFDVTQIVLYMFWFFFAGLVLYLHRESKREGYPLHSDRANERVQILGFPAPPPPKTYKYADGSTMSVPGDNIEERPIAATPIGPWPGAPLEPDGNPMIDGVGPASYALRENHPDLTLHGEPRIAPLRTLPAYGLAERDPDPRGYTVLGMDGEAAGTVCDVWIDRADPQVRFLEVELDGANAGDSSAGEAGQGSEGGTESGIEGSEAGESYSAPTTAAGDRVLLPINFAHVSGPRKQTVKTRAVKAEQFQWAPRCANPDEVTLREEDQIGAFFASGFLYATPERSEPLL